MVVTRPPRLLEWLLSSVLSPSRREAVLGDLSEEFVRRSDLDGRFAALRYYAREFLLSLGPSLLDAPHRLPDLTRVLHPERVLLVWFALILVLVGSFLASLRI